MPIQHPLTLQAGHSCPWAVHLWGKGEDFDSMCPDWGNSGLRGMGVLGPGWGKKCVGVSVVGPLGGPLNRNERSLGVLLSHEPVRSHCLRQLQGTMAF